MDMHTVELTDAEAPTLQVPATGEARMTWEYDVSDERLMALYQRGKERQWDAASRIPWELEVDRGNPLGQPEKLLPIYGSRTWERFGHDRRFVSDLFLHTTAWQFSQFLHGEQGALVCASRIVETVPDLESKFYASTQVVDEARHMEAYSRFVNDKLGLLYPINPALRELLEQTLADSRWDMPYLGMQVLIEGLALAAFGLLRDATAGGTAPLPHALLAYVMQDEARHVAFGRLSLRRLYGELSSAELKDRQEFVIEGSRLLFRRFRGDEMWEALGLDRADCVATVESSPSMRAFRSLLFSRVVPALRDIGLWSEQVAAAYEQLGLVEYATYDLDALMARDENIARTAEREQRELTVRKAQVAETIAVGATAGRGGDTTDDTED
ncbi:ferritin-like domain-containing protein [Streptomyces sp. 8N706]|uniref:ferritin-like domain-containing protein n=1 Tax=Streptomyces sp. 8N706 TaxID=3457416 RepID=UPI003FD2C44B